MASKFMSLLLLFTAVHSVALEKSFKFDRDYDTPTRALFESNYSRILQPFSGISQSCNEDFGTYLVYVYGIINSPPGKAPLWVYQLLDATGRPGTGVLEGNIQWLGSFTECLKIEATEYNSTVIKFRGQYCNANFAIDLLTPIHQQPTANHVQNQFMPILHALHQKLPFGIGPTLGLCMPSSCTAAELTQLLNETLTISSITGVTLTVDEGECYKDEANEYSFGSITLMLSSGITMGVAIIMIMATSIKKVVLAAFAVLLILGTLYEIVTIIRRRNKDGSTPIEKSTLERLVLCFSVYKNSLKILDTSHAEGTLTCLHGIRFLSMAWVVLGHAYAFSAFMPIRNWNDLPAILSKNAFDIIMNAPFSVDTFFFLSGFLVAYLFLKEMKKTGGEFGPSKIFLFYFHRYWRLTPALAMGVAFLTELYKYLGHGPNWRAAESFTINTCQESWWKNLLYIQNLYNFKDMCFVVSWYLACDMQYYIVSLVIIYPLYRYETIGQVILGAFFLASMIIPGLIIHINDLPVLLSLLSFSDPKEISFQNHVYIKPWCRMGPYIVGIILAVVLHKTTLKPKLKPAVVAIGWLLTTVLALTLLFGMHNYFIGDSVMSNGFRSFYGACSRPAWAIVVAWVVFACVTGYGGFVNTLLSWKALIPLSRLTYSTYLLHAYILIDYFASQETIYYFNHYMMVILYLGMLVVSIALAFVYSLAFEAPMIELEKIFLPSRRPTEDRPLPIRQNRWTNSPPVSTMQQPSAPDFQPVGNTRYRKTSYRNQGYERDDDDDANSQTVYSANGRPFTTL